MHPSHSAGGRGVEPPTKLLKRGGGLERISILRGGCWKRGGGGDKKPYKVKMFISVITKKNSVTFKR